MLDGLESAGVMGGGAALNVALIYFLLKVVIIPKLNSICIRTRRIDVVQKVLVDVVADDHPEQDIRGRILDEIQMTGIPDDDQAIKV